MDEDLKDSNRIYTLSKLFSCCEIKLSAWSRSNKHELLALYTGKNNFIFYNMTTETPVVKEVPWFADSTHTPVSIDFSPDGTFLLVLSLGCNLYNIPVLSLFTSIFHSDLSIDTSDITIYTYPFCTKTSKQLKPSSKSPNSSLTLNFPLQSLSSNSSEKEKSTASSSNSNLDSLGNENVIKLKEILCTKQNVSPSVVCWWQSIQGVQEVAVIGTKTGDITFVDLLCGGKVGEASVKGEIKNLSICLDTSLENVFLLITLENNDQYKLMLKQKHINYIWSSPKTSSVTLNEENDSAENHTLQSNGNYLPSARTRLQGLKQMSAEKLASLKNKIAETRSKISVKQGLSEDTSLKSCGPHLENLGSIIGNTVISFQTFHEENVLAGYYTLSQLLTIHSMNLEAVPLLIHKMPSTTEEILLCDRIIFVIGDERKTIQVISSKLTETRIEQTSDFNFDSVLGKWDLISNDSHSSTNNFEVEKDTEEEYVLKIYKSQSNQEDYDLAKMYKLEKTKEELPETPKVENCVVVTNKSIYIIHLQSNIVKIALDYILKTHELEKAERICTIYGINLQKLLEFAGDIKLSDLEFPTAIALYKLSKCGLLKSIVKLACGSHCAQVLNYSLILMTNSISEMSLTERIHLSNLILMAYTQQILKNESNRNLTEKFIDFLQTNSYFDEVLAVSVTGQSLLFTCLHKLIVHKGLILDGYNVLIKLMERFINTKALDWSLNKTEFWNCVTEVNLTEAMVVKQSNFPIYFKYISQHLDGLNLEYLDRILAVLDPTAPCLRSVSRIFKNTDDSFDDDTQTIFPFGKLVELFVSVLLVKLHKQKTGLEGYEREFLFPFPKSMNLNENYAVLSEAENFGSMETLCDEIWPIRKEKKGLDSEKFKKKNNCILSSGYGHTALIRNDSVYTWGQTTKGCLGHGPTMSRYTTPTPVSWLSSFKLEVSMVACGKHHTLALTNSGVYGWGCSRYGQLGLGGIYESPYPRLLNSLSNETIVALSCGQFHSLALSSQGAVFSWGWGVHGQLGVGSIDDQRYPKFIAGLKEHFIVDIAGGHGHSIVLTDKGHVYSFGSGVFGQLGTGTTVKRSSPVFVKGLSGKIVSIATGYFHSLAVSESNVLYTWGSSPQCLRFQAQARKRSRLLQNQQLAASSDSEATKSSSEEANQQGAGEPTEGTGLLDKSESEMHLTPSIVNTTKVTGIIIQVSCGCHHSALVTDSGSLYTWGRSLDGQLGNGGNLEVVSPTQIGSDNLKVDCVSCGNSFTTAQEKHTGKIFTWGSNSVGQLAIPIKESATKSLDGKLVMLKSCKRIVRLLDRNAGSNSIDTPTEVADIPLPAFTYHTLSKPNASQTQCLSELDPKYTQRSLNFVIENFKPCINLNFILSKSLEYHNYQVASKIALLQNNCKQSLVYQLKALQSLPKYHTKSGSYMEKQETVKGILSPESELTSPESEIHLFTVQGGAEDMCDESRFQNIPEFCDSEGVKTKEKKVETEKDEMGAGMCCTVLKNEYIDHAKYILESYLNFDSSLPYKVDKISILETGIQFWTAEKLPMSSLETFFMGKLDNAFYEIAYGLFCQSKENQTPILEYFSSSFLITIASKILDFIENNGNCVEFLEVMSKMLVKDKIDTKAESFRKKIFKKKKPKCESYLETIEENLKDQWINENFINIAYGDIIAESIYFFSCGHCHSSKSLKEECKVLEEINDEKATLKLVKIYESMGETNQADIACPLCVRNFLRQ